MRLATCKCGDNFTIIRETGEKYEVDHIVPLRGKTVSGLHVEHNLQVIPMHDNRVKYNSAITGGNA